MKFALASLLTLSLAALPSLAAPTPAPAGHLSSLELESYCQPKQGQIGTVSSCCTSPKSTRSRTRSDLPLSDPSQLFVIEYEDGVVDTIPADKCFSLHSPDGAAPSVIRSCQKAICYLDSCVRRAGFLPSFSS